MGRGSVGRKLDLNRNRLHRDAMSGEAGSKLLPPARAITSGITPSAVPCVETVRDAFVHALRDAVERQGLREVVAGALLDEAKRAVGASATACYGRALYEDVGDALGVDLVKVGRRFLYRTRARGGVA